MDPQLIAQVKLVQQAYNDHTESEKSSESMYDVEKIVDKRVSNNSTEYLIKWTGYPTADNEWKREEELAYVTELVEDYELQLKNKKKQQNRKQVQFQGLVKKTNIRKP